jgi:hypothetical protein
MSELWLHQVEAWREFYLLVGTAGAALVGLMFVVVSLNPQVIATKPGGVRAFYTPIIFNFTTALVISGLMMAPGLTPVLLAIILSGIGVVGLIYQISTRVHTRWRESALPWVDLVWYVGLPLLSHAVILAAAIGIWRQGIFGLYAAAAAVLLLLITGIRNAWDLVLWIAERPRP